MTYTFMRRVSVVLALAGLTTATGVQAARGYAAANSAEASMMVTGSLVLAPDGSVRSYTIDKRSELPAPVVELIDKNAPGWRFERVRSGGRPVAVKADMSLRVLARPLDGEHYALSIRSARFGKQDDAGGIRQVVMEDPVYPREASRSRVGGTVYLLLKLDASGHVAAVAAEQTNLATVGSENMMKRWRKAFESASTAAASHWVFQLPARPPGDTTEGAYVRIPMRFRSTPHVPSYGQWDMYLPGPRNLVPWFIDEHMVSDNADALPDSGVFPVGSGLHLLTPLGGV